MTEQLILAGADIVKAGIGQTGKSPIDKKTKQVLVILN